MFTFIEDDWLTKFHRNGWAYVSSLLRTLHAPDAVPCYSWLDMAIARSGGFRRPWTGFLHNPITFPDQYPHRYNGLLRSLERLVASDHWRASLRHCKGVFTLSEVTRDFLLAHGVRACSVTHPVPPAPVHYSPDRFVGVVHIGQMLRRFHDFIDLPTRTPKLLVRVAGHDEDYRLMYEYSRDKTPVPSRGAFAPHEYDQLLASSVVFLSLYDCSACNTILECVAAHTPLLVNPLPAVREYLGDAYPYYFTSLEEAARKLEDEGLRRDAHLYLAGMDKRRFSGEEFLRSLTGSEVYRGLPAVKLL
jgi:hypothetical protein